jgi:hypothetical protein
MVIDFFNTSEDLLLQTVASNRPTIPFNIGILSQIFGLNKAQCYSVPFGPCRQ